MKNVRICFLSLSTTVSVAFNLPCSLPRSTYYHQWHGSSHFELSSEPVSLRKSVSATILHLVTSLCHVILTSVGQLLYLICLWTHSLLSFDACLHLSQLITWLFKDRDFIIPYDCLCTVLCANPKYLLTATLAPWLHRFELQYWWPFQNLSLETLFSWNIK